MPQTRSTPAGSGVPPAPVAILVPRPRQLRPTPNTRGRIAIGPGDWCNLQPHHLAHLIAALTQRGDPVVDLDRHPTVADAARFLGRRPVHLPEDGVRPAPPARGRYGRPGVG